MAANDAEFHAELRALLAEGRKIEAVKLYREQTGTGLAEAKRAVEALEGGQPQAAGKAVDSALEAEILPLLQQGRKIEAIKIYRERMGTGLKDAKQAVESIAADRGILPRSGPGCLGVLLLWGLLLAAIIPVLEDFFKSLV